MDIRVKRARKKYWKSFNLNNDRAGKLRTGAKKGIKKRVQQRIRERLEFRRETN